MTGIRHGPDTSLQTSEWAEHGWPDACRMSRYRGGQNISAVRWFSMIYWDQVSWKDPLIISSSQERLHYTGNCFYFIWPHLFLTELITELTSNVWELRAGIRRWLQVSECEECVGGWLSRSAHHVWCGLWRGQPIMGRGGVSLQMARVITLCLTRDTFYQWWLARAELRKVSEMRELRGWKSRATLGTKH